MRSLTLNNFLADRGLSSSWADCMHTHTHIHTYLLRQKIKYHVSCSISILMDANHRKRAQTYSKCSLTASTWTHPASFQHHLKMHTYCHYCWYKSTGKSHYRCCCLLRASVATAVTVVVEFFVRCCCFFLAIFLHYILYFYNICVWLRSTCMHGISA